MYLFYCDKPYLSIHVETCRVVVIAYPEKEIHNIKHTGVFCVDT